MSGFSKIIYKGKEILYLDHRGRNEDEMIETLKEAEAVMLAENKLCMQLINISNAFATPNFMKIGNEAGKRVKHLTLKSAVVGVTGAKKVLLNGYNALTGGKMKAFETEEEAKEFLIE